MKNLIIVGIILLLCGCSQKETGAGQNLPKVKEETVSQASFPFPLVKWNDQIYMITDTALTDVDKEIGEITIQSTNEIADSPNNFSTSFPKGSKLFSIPGIDTAEAIAVQVSNTKYIKVVAPLE